MRAVVVFTIVYTIGLFVYGSMVESSLTDTYTGINIGLFVLFAVLHRWARWPVPALWAASLVGLGNMLGGVLLIDGNALYMAEVLGPLRYDKVFTPSAPVRWWSSPGRRSSVGLLGLDISEVSSCSPGSWSWVAERSWRSPS